MASFSINLILIYSYPKKFYLKSKLDRDKTLEFYLLRFDIHVKQDSLFAILCSPTVFFQRSDSEEEDGLEPEFSRNKIYVTVCLDGDTDC